MEIKVYISMPRDYWLTMKRVDLMDKLVAMANGVHILFLGAYPPMALDEFDIFTAALPYIKECDFIVFANGSDNYEHCRVEKAAATAFGIPSCNEDEFPQFIKGYMTQRYNKAMQGVKAREKVTSALNRLALLQESKCNISQDAYVIEECSELIKEFIKSHRGKDNKKDVVAEACDVITSVLVLFRLMHVPEEHICEQIIYKCNRAVKRFDETGKF